MPKYLAQPKPVGGVQLFDSTQVCELTGLSYASVIAAVKRGELRVLRVGGKLLFPSAQFELPTGSGNAR